MNITKFRIIPSDNYIRFQSECNIVKKKKKKKKSYKIILQCPADNKKYINKIKI